MKSIHPFIQLAFVIFLFQAIPTLAGNATGQAQPHIKRRGSLQFEEDAIRMVGNGSEKQIQATFIFTNRGEYPVIIEDIVTSCGCTTADLDKRMYKPGESGEIAAIYKPGKYEGIKRNRIIVQTNDAEKRRYFLNFEIEIPRMLELSPRILYWRPEEIGKTKKINILVKSESPITIEDLKLRNKGFLVKLKTIEAGRHYEILVTPDPEKRNRRSGITILTSYPPEKPKSYYAHLIMR